jgi:hypothetical protein
MRQLISLAIASLILAFGPSVTAGGVVARATGVRDCQTWAHYPNVLISSVRNMGCRRAARDMRRYQGPISKRFTTPRGFRCTQQSGVPVGGQWRCVRGHKAYRFEFGD